MHCAPLSPLQKETVLPIYLQFFNVSGSRRAKSTRRAPGAHWAGALSTTEISVRPLHSDMAILTSVTGSFRVFFDTLKNRPGDTCLHNTSEPFLVYLEPGFLVWNGDAHLTVFL